jgi:hypothetical protein
MNIAATGSMNPKLYDFLETSLNYTVHENIEDIVEDKIFKYKYRQNADDAITFARRMDRVCSRFMERAKLRDSAIEVDLAELYEQDDKDSSFAQAMLDPSKLKATARDVTNAHREYMAREGVQQFRDYYESDKEEVQFGEYLDNLSNRDRVRFMEIFEDFTVDKGDDKAYAMIKKREFNPELSAFSNLVLDL